MVKQKHKQTTHSSLKAKHTTELQDAIPPMRRHSSTAYLICHQKKSSSSVNNNLSSLLFLLHLELWPWVLVKV